jgi:hypothetical protein
VEDHIVPGETGFDGNMASFDVSALPKGREMR